MLFLLQRDTLAAAFLHLTKINRAFTGRETVKFTASVFRCGGEMQLR
jgi:hypothetical protein